MSVLIEVLVLSIQGIHSTANPAYTADELHYQLTTVKTSLLLVHPDVVDTAQVAAKKAGLSVDRVVLFECLPNSIPASHPTFQDLITEGLSKDISFVEKRLAPGEAKTKLAVLCFSSGTTGRPKVCARTFGHVASANV
jgi:4-coumarate--CoA ligase